MAMYRGEDTLFLCSSLGCLYPEENLRRRLGSFFICSLATRSRAFEKMGCFFLIFFSWTSFFPRSPGAALTPNVSGGPQLGVGSGIFVPEMVLLNFPAVRFLSSLEMSSLEEFD